MTQLAASVHLWCCSCPCAVHERTLSLSLCCTRFLSLCCPSTLYLSLCCAQTLSLCCLRVTLSLYYCCTRALSLCCSRYLYLSLCCTPVTMSLLLCCPRVTLSGGNVVLVADPSGDHVRLMCCGPVTTRVSRLSLSLVACAVCCRHCWRSVLYAVAIAGGLCSMLSPLLVSCFWCACSHHRWRSVLCAG
jgi:hypothetical protein